MKGERFAIGVGVLAVAASAALAVPEFDVNYDLAYALGWGAEILNGSVPDYGLEGAPTPHPLTTAMTTVADLAPFGEGEGVMHAVSFLAYGLLVVCVALLGAELFSWAAGILAAVAIAVSPPVLVSTGIAFQDVMTAALIVLAVLLEVRRPGRGWAPLVALSLAGLLRPEAWGLAGAYWLWQQTGRETRERARLGLLALSAPALWLLSDLLITGKPLFSLVHTREGAERAQRTTGLADAPDQLVTNLQGAVGRGVLVGGAIGAIAAGYLAWRGRGLLRRGKEVDARVAAPLGALVLLCGAFLALGLSELSLLERYVLGIGALLAVFFGFALTCWHHVASRGAVVAAAAVAALVAIDAGRGAPGRIDQVHAGFDYHRAEHAVLEDLRDLADGLGPLIARCGSVSVDSYRTRPYLARALGRQPREVERSPEFAPSRSTVRVVPAGKRARDVFILIGRDGGAPPRPPRGFRRAEGNASWAAYTRACAP